MSQQRQEIKSNNISLKGSAALVKQYLKYALNHIIFQRELCPPDDFEVRHEYGIALMHCKNEKIARYLERTLGYAEKYLEKKGLDELNFAIFEQGSTEIYEKWVFEIEYDDEKNVDETDVTMIKADIRAVLRQIITCINVLPLIDPSYKFRIVFRPSSLQVAALIPFEMFPFSLDVLQSEELSLRSISTQFHKVNTKVVYKQVPNC